MPFHLIHINEHQVALHWHEWGKKDRPLVICFHGFMGRGEDWRFIAQDLQASFHVIAPDLPFHGKTVLPDVLLEHPPDFRQIVASLAQWLQMVNKTPVGLLGYSMGGRLALALSLEFPHLVNKLVLESSSPGIPTESGRKKRQQTDTEMAAQIQDSDLEAFLRSWYQAPMWGNLNAHPDFERLIAQRRQNDPRQLVAALQSMGTGSQPSYWPHLETLAVPVLLLAGEFDSRYIHIMDAMRRQLPQAYFQVVAQCGHNIHFEQPEIFIKLVRNFLMD